MEQGKWSYPLNNDGEIKGFNDQGIEHFLGNPIESLAKEIIQNSIDAGIENENKPVKVVFKTFYLETKKILGLEKLKSFYKHAITSWENDIKVKQFAINALEILDGEYVKCLRISDFNTKGITGSERYNQSSAWFNLTKGSGSTEKVGIAGGSKGIGKNAVYANSLLRLVYYSTRDVNGIEATQGLLKMVSLKGLSQKSETEQTSGPIYFGDEIGHKPLQNYHSLDESYSRNSNETGSDIFVIGFNPINTNWETKIKDNTLLNFMYAIHSNKLEVEVEGYAITKNNYLSYIQNKKVIKKDILSMAKVLNDENTITKIFEFENYGDYEIKVLKMNETEAFKKCWLIRRPWMMITSVKQSLLPVLPFSSLVIIKGFRLNELLRKLESAKHDGWEIERASNLEEKEQAELILSTINKNIVNSIKEAFNITNSEFLVPPGNEIELENDGSNPDIEKEVINSQNPTIDLFKSKSLRNNPKTQDSNEKLIYNPETGKLEESDDGDYTAGGEETKGGKPRKKRERNIRTGDNLKLVDGNDNYNLVDPNSITEARVAIKNFREHRYTLYFKLDKNYKKISIRLNEIDSEGKPSFKVLIDEAYCSGKSIRVTNHVIFLTENLIKEMNQIDFISRNPKYFTTEVLIYGIEK